jgi:hypothetical protein
VNRLTAAVGGGLGAVGGAVAGLLIGERIPPQPGYTPADDEGLVLGVAAFGSFVGAAIGAAIGTESDVAAVAHLCPPSRIGTSGLGELQREWGAQ